MNFFEMLILVRRHLRLVVLPKGQTFFDLMLVLETTADCFDNGVADGDRHRSLPGCWVAAIKASRPGSQANYLPLVALQDHVLTLITPPIPSVVGLEIDLGTEALFGPAIAQLNLAAFGFQVRGSSPQIGNLSR